jgi:hypothetical protein
MSFWRRIPLRRRAVEEEFVEKVEGALSDESQEEWGKGTKRMDEEGICWG